MIEIKNLQYGSLVCAHLLIPPGLTVIRGKNGAGKTTLLSLISGLVLPEQGEIRIDSQAPREISAGYVSEFPDRHLLFSRVYDEIASPLRFARMPEDAIRTQTERLADMFGISHLLYRECKTLSGGEKIMTGVASAAAGSPLLLVLDEPDSHLDPETTADLIRVVRGRNIPYIIWSSHSPQVISSADFEVCL